ncbi:DUF397 domain-containing protein [Actinomadura terrae]|uniref:DUF397 domain-containing protein n=1 Tax=Actinomadura terrae TaxID=604353 RepID=UPI001FA6F325|nr:DUF397 domain-containing protein [Actinomadura terrae]
MSTSDLANLQWRKSSRSSGQGGQCVEVATHTTMIAVRDSKDPNGPRLAFSAAEWHGFTQRVKADHLHVRG